jgi:hypothetical protein
MEFIHGDPGNKMKSAMDPDTGLQCGVFKERPSTEHLGWMQDHKSLGGMTTVANFIQKMAMAAIWTSETTTQPKRLFCLKHNSGVGTRPPEQLPRDARQMLGGSHR